MSFFFFKYSFFYTSSEQWNLPESCIIPWQELLNFDENDQIPENDDIDSLMLQIDEKKNQDTVSQNFQKKCKIYTILHNAMS